MLRRKKHRIYFKGAGSLYGTLFVVGEGEKDNWAFLFIDDPKILPRRQEEKSALGMEFESRRSSDHDKDTKK